jgi:hypothetical protein
VNSLLSAMVPASPSDQSKYLFCEMWLREKESNLQFRVQSPTCCQLHHPGKCVFIRVKRKHEFGCGGRTRTFDIRINNPAPYQLGYATRNLVAAGGFEPPTSRL